MNPRERLDELHHRMAMEVKAIFGEAAMVITVISISESPGGQMVLCDADRHAKIDAATRLRIAADCLAPTIEQLALSRLSSQSQTTEAT